MKIVLRQAHPGTGVRVVRRLRALTMVELMIVVAVLTILAVVILLPAHVHRTQSRRPRIQCANNLKQVGLAFWQFASDNDDNFPQSLSANQGGFRDLVNVGPGGAGDPSRTFWLFATMSNELATPKTVVCPYDRARVAVSNFYGVAYAMPLAQGGQNASVSYFVNLAAAPSQPQAILSGDRNLSTVTNPRRASDYDAFFGVEQRIHPADVKPGGAYANLEFHNTIHQRKGLVLLADGSVHPATGATVRARITASTNTHRLIFPFVPGKNE